MATTTTMVAALLLIAACEAGPGDASSTAGVETSPSTAPVAPGGSTVAAPTAPPGPAPAETTEPAEPSDSGPPNRTDIVTGGTAVSLPGANDPRPESIRAVDFAELTYPSSICADVIDHPPRGGYHLHDGETHVGEDEGDGPYRVELLPTRSFGDINGDGHEDAALVLACSRGGQSVPMGWIYTLDESGPRPLAGVDLDPDSLPITGVLDTALTAVRINATEVVTEWDVYIDGDALCCPAKTAEVVWTWTDNGLTPGSPSLMRTAG